MVMVILVAIIAAGAVSAVLVALSSVAQANAQQQKMTMMMTMGWGEEAAGQGIPEIKGSVSVANKTVDFIGENVKVQFATAAEAAQSHVIAGTVLGGNLGVVQGYLVYTFFVADIANHAGQTVIVDAGNGQVLYTSSSHTLGSSWPMMSGQWSGHSGYGVGGGSGGWWWDGPWKDHGFGWGAWH